MPALSDTASPAWPVEVWAEAMDLAELGGLVVRSDGGVDHLSARMQTLLGLPSIAPADVAGLDACLQARLPAHEPRKRPLMRLFQDAQGKTDALMTLKFTRPLAQVLQLKARALPDGRVVLVARDVTQAEELDQRRQAFLSVAAHEIRTPLASVYGYAELLIKREHSPAQKQSLLGIIYRQAGQLVTLINELLDLSRIEARRGLDFQRQACTVDTLVRHVLADWSMPDDPRQVCVGRLHGDLTVWVDPDKVRLAVVNVLSNAFKYSPQGGDIHLETVCKSLDARPWVGIRVRDPGMGMGPEEVARVFERFYRAHPNGPIAGTGLGMSLVKEITECHEGHVQLVSKPGVGTEVTLWFAVRDSGSGSGADAG